MECFENLYSAHLCLMVFRAAHTHFISRQPRKIYWAGEKIFAKFTPGVSNYCPASVHYTIIPFTRIGPAPRAWRDLLRLPALGGEIPRDLGV